MLQCVVADGVVVVIVVVVAVAVVACGVVVCVAPAGRDVADGVIVVRCRLWCCWWEGVACE